MLFIIAIAISALLSLAGLFLLLKVKKENLGIIYKIAAYKAMFFGSLLIIAAIVMGVCKLSHCSSKGCSKSAAYAKYYHGGDSSCSAAKGFHHAKLKGHCSSFSKGHHSSAKCCAHSCKGKKRMCKKSATCSKESCSKKDCMHKTKKIEVEIEAEEDDGE